MFGAKTIKCDHCGNDVPADSEICPKCGFQLRDYREAIVKGNTWVARPGELAGRIDIADLKGFFSKRLTVLPGTWAHIFQDGRYVGNVQGFAEYDLDTFLGKLNRLLRDKPATVIVTRDAEIDVELEVKQVPTAEFLDLDVPLTVGVAIDRANPAGFLSVMGDRPVFGQRDMAALLFQSVRQVLREIIRPKSIRELQADPDLRTGIDDQIHQRLKGLFSRYGLLFTGVHTVGLRHEAFDANNAKRGEAWIAADSKRIDLESARQLHELYSEEQMLDIEKMRTDTQMHALRREMEAKEAEDEFTLRVRRIDLLEKSVAADSREAAIQLGGKEELDRLEHSARHAGMLRENERLGWEQEQALLRVQLAQEKSLAEIEREGVVARARIRLEGDLEMERYQAEIGLAKRVQEDEHARVARDEAHKSRLREMQRSEQTRDAEQRQNIVHIEIDTQRVKDDYQREQKLAWEHAMISLGREKAAAEVEQRIDALRAEEKAYDLRKREAEDKHRRDSEVRGQNVDIALKLADADRQRALDEAEIGLKGKTLDVDVRKEEIRGNVEIEKARAAAARPEPKDDEELAAALRKQLEEKERDKQQADQRLRESQSHSESLVRTVLDGLNKSQTPPQQPVIVTSGAPAQPTPSSGDNDALRNLKRRLANGEIDEEEYLRLKRLLSD